MVATEIDHDLDISAQRMHRSAENNRFWCYPLAITDHGRQYNNDKGCLAQLFVTTQQKYRNKVFLLSVLLPRTGGTMNLLTTSSKQLHEFLLDQ